MAEVRYPHVRVAGPPRERGREYGEQARERVRRSVEAYAAVYVELAGLRWPEVLDVAAGYAEAIARFEPRYLEEMRGLAEGSGQSFEAILAINVRTEIMFAAKARQARAHGQQAAGTGRPPRLPGECTAVAALPTVTDSGHTLLAQNWDWLPHARETTVVLEALQEEGPAFVTVVEAGLLAKTGFNSHGVALATNALISDADVGAVGVPYHVVLRALLDARDLPTALASLQRATHSSSANYMLAQRDGLAVDVEARPGDYSRLRLLEPEHGLLVHTNHFLSRGDFVDVGLWWMPGSFFRSMRARGILEERRGPVTVELLQTLFSDHVNHPDGICAHADPRDKPSEQGETVVSVIMDVEKATLWLADGTPCSAGYRRVDYGEFLSSAAAPS